MSDIYTTSDASSNMAPTITVSVGQDRVEGTYTGAPMAPFLGVYFWDEEYDDLTLTLTFDTTFGDVIFPSGIAAATSDDGPIRTYTLTGRPSDLTNIIQNTLFDANDSLNHSGADDAIFTFGVKDADHETFATASVTVQLTDGGPSNMAPTITVAGGQETVNGTYTGAPMAPFLGVTLWDGEYDDLTLTLTFDTTFGDIIFPGGIAAAVSDNGPIRTYTLTGRPGDLTNIIQNTLFDANDSLNHSGADDAIFTFGVKDADHDTFATASVTVQLTDGGPSNAAPTITVAGGWETSAGTYTGAVMAPFAGVALGDQENNDLTFTLTFDTTFGDIIFPSGIAAAVSDNGTIRTYTLMGRAADLANIIQNTLFDANDSLNHSGPDDAVFTFGVKDSDHDTFATASVTVQLTDGGPAHSAPVFSIASGTEVTNAGYLGRDVSPFRGVTLADADNDLLFVDISFDPSLGSITLPWGTNYWEDKGGLRIYKLMGYKDGLTELIQNITFDPNNDREGSGRLDAIFTLSVTDQWQGTPVTASVTVAMDNGVPPNAPPEIDVVDDTETTTTTYTNPDNVSPFLGMSFTDEGDELMCRVTYDDLYGDLIFPPFAEAWSFTDEVTGFRVFVFAGNAAELTSVMHAVQFDPRDEMSGSGRTTTIFSVSVTDSGDNLVTNTEVSVVLDDPVDPNEAPFNLTLSNAIIDESSAPVIVGVLNASDPDGDPLGYLLVDAEGNEVTDTSPFEIQTVRVGLDGQVVHRLATKSGIQVAADELHNVHIQVSDGRGGSVTEMFRITVKNVVPPNAAPLIVVADGLAVTNATDTGENVRPFVGVSFDDAEDDDLKVTITFDPAGGSLVLPAGMQVTPSSDLEKGTVTYTFDGKKAALAALMDTLAFDPVRETRSSGTVTTAFTITVQDSTHTPVTNGTVEVVTTITDKNRAPANVRLEGSDEGVTIAESATQIGTLSAEDQDGDTLEWLFAQDGNAGGMFVIDGDTIKLAEGKRLDVDGPGGVSSYTIHVKARDGNGGEIVKSFVVAVTNVNDNAPTAIRLNSQTSLDVVESTKVGDFIGTLTATDADGSPIVSYAMEDNAFFEIVRNADTGAFEVRLKAGVDYETAAQRAHVLRITASDGVNASAPQDITISVTNVNEAPTGLIAEGGLANNLSVPEDAAVGAVIAALSGQDPDAGETFTYTLATDAMGAAAASHPFFEVVGDKILLKSGLDDAQIGAHDLWVRVADARGLSTVQKVTITVADVDEKPSGLLVTGGTVAEGALLHTVAATLSGLDPDAGDTFTYHLVTDNTGATDATHALFEIVGNQIRVKAGLDDAQVGAYDLWVRVTDASKLSTVQKVTVTVANVNEAPTSLLLSNTAVYESGSAIQIGTLSAADADGDTLRYDIVDAYGNVTGDSPFETLTANASGAVRLATKAGIQVSSDETHVVYIKVSDGKGGSLIKNFGITIKDVNVAPTKLTLSNTVVDESSAAIKVGILNATDTDGDELTYILVDGDGTEVTDTSPFEIQEIRANGVKVHRLATKAGIQVEGDEERDVWIRVSDGKSSVTEKFTITIRDVAHTPTNVAPTLFIAADAANVRASDLDGPIKPFMGVSFNDAEDDVLTVSVSFDPAGGDLVLTPETWATSVALNPETGAKTYIFSGRKAELAALMDRLSFDPIQQPGNSGTVRTVFKISVKDALHDAVSDNSLNVVTAITNKNHAPEGIGLSGSLVSENAGSGTLVGTLSAHDRDAGDTLVYTLSDDRFYIDGNQLKVKDGSKLDFEAAQSHQITIQVSDGVTIVGQTYTISIGDMVETLTGTKGKDLLQGGAGSDVIKGEYGNDTLLGNGGQDFFVFKTKLGTSKTDRKVNFDTIKDFNVVEDSLWLDDKIFKNAALKKLGKGASEANPKQLTSKFFKIGNEAKDKDDYIIYNKKTGVLSYDADGSGSKHNAVEFANIGKNLAPTSKDFFII